MLLKLGEQSFGLEEGHRHVILDTGNTAWSCEFQLSNLHSRWKLDGF